MTPPPLASTLAFSAIVAAVIFAVIFGIRSSTAREGRPEAVRSATLWSAGGSVALLSVSALAAESGLLRAAGAPALMFYLGASNAIAVAVAFSPVGQRLAVRLPAWALVGFQIFRLPLELVLHAWFVAGAVPVQMTYSGHNFDILTGILALSIAPTLFLLERRAARASATTAELLTAIEHGLLWFFNLSGSLLLLNVASIAVRSSPVPFRSYFNEPVLLLAYRAPYTWIVPVCVAGALLGHLVTFRRLFANPRGEHAAQP